MNADICGSDPDNHAWTSDGEGVLTDSHCRLCGLHRRTHRNTGEHDTVVYRVLDDETIERHIANGEMDELTDPD